MPDSLPGKVIQRGWRSAPVLVIARDGVTLDEFEVVAFARDDGSVLCTYPDGLNATHRRPIPALPTAHRARYDLFARLEEALPGERTGARAHRREAAVPDSLLQAPTLAAIREQLGLGATGAPFRSSPSPLSAETASSLLDDRAATRAELLASSLVLAARGDATDRVRIRQVSKDCADAVFVALLCAVADGDALAEALYRQLGERPRSSRVLEGLPPRSSISSAGGSFRSCCSSRCRCRGDKSRHSRESPSSRSSESCFGTSRAALTRQARRDHRPSPIRTRISTTFPA